MFKNYLISAIRSLKRYKLFTLLNIFGLATGLTCSILIFLWVNDERSYDKFNDHVSRIYRLTANVSGVNAAVTPPGLAGAAKQQIPAFKNYTRLSALHSIVTIGNKKFDEKNVFYADSTFLQMFNYPLLQGDKAIVLSRPDGVIITAATANKYFGSQNAIGKTLEIANSIAGNTYVVTGVLKDIPHNSHLQFDLLLPISFYDKMNTDKWGNYDVYGYLQLDEHFDATPAAIRSLEKKIDAICISNDKSHTKSEFSLQPLTDIHLHSHFLLDVEGQGNAQYVTIFSCVALFILLIACINFMNLSTALAGQRAKEVGLRKTIGAMRFQLIIQFLGESLLVSFISLIIAIGLAWLLLPFFNNLAAKTITVNLLSAGPIAGFVAIAVFVGLVSGSYPAFFLSSFKPVKVLKGLKVLGASKLSLRNSLVVIQFAISVILMISTLVVNTQLKFISKRDIGFKKQNLLYVEMPQTGDLHNNYESLKAILAGNVQVTDYTVIEHLPTYLTTGSTDFKWNGKNPARQIIFPHIGVDGTFIKTFGMQLATGRGFNDNFKGDESNYIVNQTAVKVMGMTDATAIGQRVSLNGNPGMVIGVVKDFNFKPVQQTIEPLVLRYNKQGGFVVIRTSPANIRQVITKIKTVFGGLYPNFPFSYGFVDQDISRLYIAEQQMGKLFNVFSVVSIIVSCLGLFGLATFATQKRLKEIGVRRVLGASATGIVALLAKDFVKLVFIALIIAFPLAWLVMSNWLNNYVYRINISWWMFALAGVAALVIAFLTISYQSVKAALTNPIESLKTE